MKKLFAVFISLLILISSSNLTLLAYSPVLLIKSFNTKNNTLQGVKVDYSIKIPSWWMKTVTAEFEKNTNKQIAEKVNFYYNPTGKVNSPILFLSIYVFNRSDFASVNQLNYTVLKQNNSYIFASTSAVTNPFTFRDDKVVFDMLIANANSESFLNSIITLPANIVEKCTITVNNKRLNNKVIVRTGGLCFFPIKEICETLGYSVSWNNKSSCVVITGKNNYYREFYPNHPSKNSGYSVIINNGVSYINSFYFIWDLGVNFEIDDNFNTYITT